jgi:hypothetical protein
MAVGGQRKRGAGAVLGNIMTAKTDAIADHPDAFNDLTDLTGPASEPDQPESAELPDGTLTVDDQTEEASQSAVAESVATPALEPEQGQTEPTELAPVNGHVVPEQRAPEECWFDGCKGKPVAQAMDLPGVPADAEICQVHLDLLEPAPLGQQAAPTAGDIPAIENQTGQHPGQAANPAVPELGEVLHVVPAVTRQQVLLASMDELEEQLVEEIRTPTTVNLTEKLARRATKYADSNGLSNIEVLTAAVFGNLKNLPKLVAQARSVKQPRRGKIKHSISPTDAEMADLEAAVAAVQIRLGDPRHKVTLSEVARVAIEAFTAPKPRKPQSASTAGTDEVAKDTPAEL